MKVTTVACIQGAWLPDYSPKNILDIGAGTGILSLMAAQKYNCPIDAVEIEHDAFLQLKENTSQNPLGNRIQCFHQDILLFANTCKQKYDFIISNPPFYQNQLKSSNDKINRARHETGLTILELLKVIEYLHSDSGKISILLPPTETDLLYHLAIDKGLFPNQQLAIYDTREKNPKAIVTILSRKSTKVAKQKLIIKNETGAYTTDFISLLKDYYLYM